MLKLNRLRLPVGHTKEQLEHKIRKLLHLRPDTPLEYRIVKRSLDARKKPELFFEYSVEFSLPGEESVGKKNRGLGLQEVRQAPYTFKVSGQEKAGSAPVIVGSGPAGLFCAYLLSLHGYCPLILEQGEAVDERTRSVAAFWEKGKLNPDSNVQFGEGGAGTFSDGKLNTLVKDTDGRSRFVLDTFVRFGAPSSILYENKPHLGTDQLTGIIRNMRKEIESLGGRYLFSAKATDFVIKDGRVRGVIVKEDRQILAEPVVLAIGHSSRDTFYKLFEKKIRMEAKAFAVGMRVEHPQAFINLSQLGMEEPPACLSAADYKLTHRSPDGRGIYTFCMCPGGYVVNASSEEGRLAVNGMSYYSRAGDNANSAVIVSVGPGDFGSASPLAGIEFQRRLEENAFLIGRGRIPVQLYGDFKAGVESRKLGHILPQTKGEYCLADLRGVFPEPVARAFVEGMEAFGRKIKGFDREDAVLSAVESRTSSPVRILRDEEGRSSLDGLYPAGEGAGYAGGIMSAAMDGIKTAEKIAARYRPCR